MKIYMETGGRNACGGCACIQAGLMNESVLFQAHTRTHTHTDTSVVHSGEGVRANGLRILVFMCY